MRPALAALSLLLVVLAGCPTPVNPVSAIISITATSGSAPLTVNLSAGTSTSTSGTALAFSWDLGDGNTSTSESLDHTFQNPGRYIVQLTVTDANGNTANDSAEVRVAGTGATAVITADVTSGTAPLLVRFDGTASSAPDDSIYDWYWDFGDGSTSQLAQPAHWYYVVGTYTVTLRVTTDGGVEDATTATIVVSERNGSLRFDGSQFATLRVTAANAVQSFGAFAFEAWVNADSTGGTVATIASGALTVEVLPQNNVVRVQINGSPTDGSASNLSGTWRHVAVVYDADLSGSATIFLDGVALVSTGVPGTMTIGAITLGVGFNGQIAEARFWSGPRSADEIQANWDDRLEGDENGLLGYWRIDEGAGQVLNNRGSSTINGTLGGSTATEASDPAWSTNGPPI